MRTLITPLAHRSRWTGLLIVCLAGNVALGGWIWQRLQARPPRLVGESLPVPARPNRIPPSEVAPADQSLTASARIVPFHWAELESEDYAVYIANLRGVGCPEPLIRDLIAVELESLYSDRPLPPYDPPDFWTTGNTRERFLLDYRRALQARQDERNEVYQDLLGVPFPADDADEILEQALLTWVLDFLAPERRPQVLELLHRMEDRQDRWREVTQGLVLPADALRLAELYRAWRQEVAQRFSSWEIEEMTLRYCALENGPAPDQLRGLRMTGPELRQIYRILWAGLDPLVSELGGNGPGDDPPDMEDLLETPERQEQIARFLGPRRARLFWRNVDPSYEPLLDFTQRTRLAEDVKNRLYAAHRAALSMAEELQGDAALSAEERNVLLTEVRASLELAVRQNLEPDLAQRYLERSARWRERRLGGSL